MQKETDSPARAIERSPFAAPSKYFDTPLRLLILVIASVFIAEAAVMLLFTILPPLLPLVLIFLDAFLLIILVFPALYFFLLRPLTRQIEERRRVEVELHQAQAELETRVQDRTQELMIANQELHDEILERQEVEARLRESEERLRALYVSMTEGLANLELVYEDGQAIDYIITDVNPAFERITDLARSEAVGRKASELYGGESPPYLDVYARVAAGGAPESFETYFVPLSKHFAISGFSPGNGQVATVFSDITARKQAEHNLEAARAAELNEKNRLAAVMETLPVGIAITDVQGGASQVNRAYEQVWGSPRPAAHSVSDYQAYRAWWVDTGCLVQPEEWASAQAVLQGKTVIGQLWEIERFDGEHRFVLNSAAPVLDADGQVVGSAVAIQDITDLRKAGEELRESQADLKRAQAVAHTGSWRLDVLRNELRWSDETYQMFGIPQGTPMTYATFLAAVHPYDRAYVDQSWMAALRGEPYDIEHRIIAGDAEKWVHERAELEFDREGVLLGGFGIVHDITERKRAEETMAWLASFPKFNPNPVSEVDLTGRLHYLNPAAKRLLPDLAALGLQHPWLIELESVGKQFQINGTRVMTREVVIGESTYQQTLHFVSNYQRIRMYGLDITERKRAEGILLKVNEVLEAKVEARTAELTRMYEALRRSEQQLRSIIDNSTDGITLVDENGIILEWNHGQESITGLPRAEVIGCLLWDVLARITVPEHRSPERHEQIKALALQAIDSGQLPGVHQPPERSIVRPNGARRIVQPRPSPIKTEKGYMTVSITRDVTESKLAAQALERLNRALRMLIACSAAQIHAADESDLLDEICRLIVETGGYRMAWVGFAEQDEARRVRPVAQYGFEEGYLDQAQITWADTERGRGPTGAAIRTGVAQVNQDFLTDPRMAPWREAALIRGYQSSIALPLKDERSTYGALMIYSSAPDAFDAEEAGQLTKLANDLAFGINALRAEAAIRQLSSAVEQTADTVVITDRGGLVEYVNPAFERLTGYTKEEASGKTPRILKSGIHDDQFYKRLWQTVLEGEVFLGEMTNRKKNGELYHEVKTITPLRDAQGHITHFVATGKDITERKRADEALRASEERFAKAFHVNPTALSITRLADGCFIDVNETFLRVLRYQREEVIGHTSLELKIYTQDDERVRLVRLLREQGSVRDYEMTARTKAGEVRSMIVSADEIEVGGELCILAMLLDVTERKQAEEQIQLQIAAMEAAANGIVITDRQGNIQWTNSAFTQMSGYAAHEVLGQSTRLFKSGKQDADFYRQMWTTILSGQVWRGEMVNRRKDGSFYTEEQTITPVLGDQGTITHFIAVKQDITDRKRAENVIRLNAARAEALSEVSRALVEASLDYQTVLDAVAHGASRMVGGVCVIHLLSEDEQWLNLATVHHADPDNARTLRQILAARPVNAHEDLIAQLIGAGQPLLMPSVPTAQLRDLFRLDADVLPESATTVSLVSVPLRLYGKLIGGVTVWRDQPGSLLTVDDQLALQRLADRAALAIDNAQLYTDLQQSLQKEQNVRQQLVQAETFTALGRIVAAVAHELNNPLQTIRNCLFLIQQDIQPDGLMHEYFQMATAEFERLTNLVAQLRALQRSHAATAMLPLDLCALIDDVHKLLEAELTAHRIRWHSSLETSRCTIVGAFDQLKQVCLNISLNALEAMRARGGALSVDLIASATGEQVGMRFRDTGTGIEPENLAKVFEPLFTTKPNGLGLGLPICYEIVQRHNGNITVESEPGHGATFTVWLPLADHV